MNTMVKVLDKRDKNTVDEEYITLKLQKIGINVELQENNSYKDKNYSTIIHSNKDKIVLK